MFTRSKAASQPDRQTSQSVPLFEIVTLHCGNQVSRAGSRQAKWDNTINQPTTCLRLSYTYKYVVLFQRESANVVNGCSTDTKKQYNEGAGEWKERLAAEITILTLLICFLSSSSK